MRTCKRTPIVCLYTASPSTHCRPPPHPHFFCFSFSDERFHAKILFPLTAHPPPPPLLFSFFLFFLLSDDRSRAKLFFFLFPLTGSNALSSWRSSLLINLFYRPPRVSWYLYQARRNWESTLSAITVSIEHNYRALSDPVRCTPMA